MPTDSLQITVLLASPGDIRAERKAVREAAESINRVSGEDQGFHLVVKGWETHTRPAAGRAQGTINDQIGPTDIFLGIMWHRLGTPTGKAASGTVEEYERARRRHVRSRAKRKPSVMFYFRQGLPRNGAGFDPDQYKAVQAFKKRVFKNNLAHEYSGPKAFAALIRDHLAIEAREIARAHRGRRARPKASPKVTKTAPKKPARRRSGASKPPARSKPRAAPKRARKPPLPVPRVPKTITDADRQRHAEKGFRSVRTRFERTAKAFNRANDHAEITVRREGDAAFVAEATVEGQRRSLARVLVTDGQWGNPPSIDYQRGESYSFYGREPSYRTELSVRVGEHDGALGFEPTSRVTWTPRGDLDEPKAVAGAFWERFTTSLS